MGRRRDGGRRGRALGGLYFSVIFQVDVTRTVVTACFAWRESVFSVSQSAARRYDGSRCRDDWRDDMTIVAMKLRPGPGRRQHLNRGI